MRVSLPDAASTRYAASVLTVEQERAIVEAIRPLPFKEFEFHGYLGKRRVVSFGWKYDYTRRSLEPTREIPGVLLDARRIAADFAGMPADDLQQILVTEYDVGAGIGWHRDKGEFGQIVGLSLLSYAVNLFILSMGRLGTGRPPVLSPGGAGNAQLFTDPVPQALVLTAIVISFATTALFLVVLLAARGLTGTDHVDGQEGDS